MEVIYDLDVEAAEAAEEAGVAFVRAATAGVDPRFVTMVRRLVLERAAVERGEEPERPALGTLGPSWDVCPLGCCANARQPGRPALCGSDRGRAMTAGPDLGPGPARRAAPRRGDRRRRGGRAGARARRPPGQRRRPQDQPHRRRHRRRPRRRGAARSPAARAAPRRRVPRRGGRSPRLGHRHHLGGRPDRRHRQLPLRHPAVRRVRGRRRRRRGLAGRCRGRRAPRGGLLGRPRAGCHARRRPAVGAPGRRR